MRPRRWAGGGGDGGGGSGSGRGISWDDPLRSYCRTDRPSYRDARMHLKIVKCEISYFVRVCY